MKSIQVKIAVCGHRHLEPTQQIQKGIQAGLESILDTFPSAHFQVYSCLAEGADRLLAACFMESLGAELIAVLPLPEDEYIKDFQTLESVQAYREFKHRAKKLIIPGQIQERPHAYQAANQHLLENCDLLVVIWDGKPGRGPGGTSETVEMARQIGLPLLWIHSEPETDAGSLTEERFTRL